MAYNIAPSKQDTLVSGTNLKTINGESLLGSTDISISSGANLTLSNLTAPTAINQQLRGTLGSVSAPAYSFTSNTNTGLCATATDLIIACGGQNMISMNSGDIYVNKAIAFSSSVFGLNNKSIAIGLWQMTGQGQVYPNIDTGGAYANRYYTIGRAGDVQNLSRPYRVDASYKMTVGKKFGSSAFAVYGATLAATQTDPITTAFTTTANNSTTIVSNTGDGTQSLVDIGDYIQLNGLAAIGRVTNFTHSYPNSTFTVDTPLGDGTSRAIITSQAVASFRKNDGTEALLINRDGNVIANGSILASELEVTNYKISPTHHDEGTETGNFTIDWANSPVQTVTLNAAGPLTVTLNNPVQGGAYALRIIQGATPGTITWPATVKWPGGTAPTLSATTGDVDIVNFLYIDDGGGNVYYYGTFATDFA